MSAQTGPITGVPEGMPTAADSQYRIHVGDTLEIAVDLSLNDFTPPPRVLVGPDGRFSYPVVGEIDAAGKTRGEIAAVIKESLERLYRKVEVAVNIGEYHRRDVFVFGEVRNQGPIPVVGEEIPLGEAIAQAGGYSQDAEGATLYRGGEPPREMSLDEMDSVARTETLEPGDVLVIERRQPLMVVGEVIKPGPLVLPRGARLTDALGMAGGVAPDADAGHAVLVNHENRTVVVDLDHVLSNPDGNTNLPVADYHTLVVPPRRAVAVVGDVAAPDLYPVRHGMRLSALIAQAGGLNQTAAAKGTAVNDSGETISVDLAGALEDPGSEADIVVQDLRTLVVPMQRRELTVVGEVKDPGVKIPQALPVTLSAALMLAGGTTENADLSRVMVSQPDGEYAVIDVQPLLGVTAVDSPPMNPLLNNGAVVTVPIRQARVVVLGAVNDAGTHTFQEGDTVVDAIALAGGFALKGARISKVGLLRRRGDKVEVTEINLRAGLAGGQDLLAGPLMDRDVVFVPRRGKGFDWAKLAGILFGVSQIIENVTD